MGAGEWISVIPQCGRTLLWIWKALSYTSGPSTCLTPENTASRHWFWCLSLPRRSGLLYAIYLSLKTMRLLNCSGMLFSIRKIFPTPCLQQIEFCQHCYRIRKTAPRSIDYSMKVVVQVRCDQNPKGNLSPDIQICSYVEEVLWNETCWWNCDNGSMKPIYEKS